MLIHIKKTKLHNINSAFPIIILFVFILTANIDAQTKLQFYLDAAFKNNPTLKENQNLIGASEIDKKLVLAEYSNPKIFVTSNYLFTPYFNNDGKLISSSPDPNAIGYDAGITNGGLYSALINIEKNIFTGGITEAYEQQSDIKIKSNRNAIEVIRHSITKDITQQFLDAYELQRLYDLSKSVADTIKKQLKLTEELVKKGLVKQSDYLLLKIEVESQVISAEQSLSAFQTSISELNSLCGLNNKIVPNLEDVQLTYDDVKTGSNYFKQFEYDSLLINSQQKIFETKYLPRINLFFNTGLNAVEFEGIQRKFGLSTGINFSMPIYDGDQKILTQQQTQINLNTVSAYKENQSVILTNKMNDAVVQLEFYKKNLLSIGNQVKNYEQVMKLAQAELFSGQRSTTDYIIMVRSFLELRKNQITTEIDYQQAINQYNYWNW